MKLYKGLKLTLMASAVVLTFGAPAMAAPAATAFGACTGAAGTDCTAGTGHASVSVTSTLSVNEMRAISFGNIAVPGAALTNTDTLVLGIDGARTGTGGFAAILLNGADGGSTGGAAGTATETGSQSPGHYTISGGAEDASATQVYISFADSTGNVIDMCDADTGGTVTGCDIYHTGNQVAIKLGGTGATGFNMDQFVINQSGSDVYGHYIDNSGAAVGTGSTTPFLPSRTAATAGTAGVVDVVVGATLHGAGTPAVGKYVGTFNIMASY